MDHHRWMKIMENALPHSYPSLIAFLAGALVSQETPRKKLCVSDHVPSRGFCFPGKRTPKNKLCVSDHVPSRGFCFPGKHIPKQNYASLIKFLAGAFVFWENMTWEKAAVFGVGVPSRGFCFLGEHDLEKAVIFGVGVPSKGFCLLGKTYPGKRPWGHMGATWGHMGAT